MGRRVRFDLARIFSRLGRQPDTELAREVSCSADRIAQYRKRLGIPAFRRVCYEELDQVLGKLRDEDVARHFSVCRATVYNRRKALGIPAYCRTQAFIDKAQRAYVEALIEELEEKEEL